MAKGFFSRSFLGRRREPETAGRLPPGQYLTDGFPVLSAGPTPYTPKDKWDFTVVGAVETPQRWSWDEFQTLPRETVTIAKNTAYDHLRRLRRIAMTPLTDTHEAIAGAAALESQFADAESLWAALNHLPDHYRLPLLLQLAAGYPLHTNAAALGCNVNTIKTRLRRAGLRFRQLYSASEEADRRVGLR